MARRRLSQAVRQLASSIHPPDLSIGLLKPLSSADHLNGRPLFTQVETACLTACQSIKKGLAINNNGRLWPALQNVISLPKIKTPHSKTFKKEKPNELKLVKTVNESLSLRRMGNPQLFQSITVTEDSSPLTKFLGTAKVIMPPCDAPSRCTAQAASEKVQNVSSCKGMGKIAKANPHACVLVESTCWPP